MKMLESKEDIKKFIKDSVEPELNILRDTVKVIDLYTNMADMLAHEEEIPDEVVIKMANKMLSVNLHELDMVKNFADTLRNKILNQLPL